MWRLRPVLNLGHMGQDITHTPRLTLTFAIILFKAARLIQSWAFAYDSEGNISGSISCL